MFKNFWLYLIKFEKTLYPLVTLFFIALFKLFLEKKNINNSTSFFQKDDLNLQDINYTLDKSTVQLRLEGVLTEITKIEKNISLWKKPVMTILEVFINNFPYKYLFISILLFILIIIYVIFSRTLSQYKPSSFELCSLISVNKSNKKGFWHIFWTIIILGISGSFWMLETFGRFVFGHDPIKALRIITKEEEPFKAYITKMQNFVNNLNFGLSRTFQYQILQTEILNKLPESNRVSMLLTKLRIFIVFWFCAHIKATENLYIPKFKQFINLWIPFWIHEVFVYAPRYFTALKEKQITILKNFDQLAEKIDLGSYKIYLDFIYTDVYFSTIYMIFCHIIIHIFIYFIITTLSWIFLILIVKKFT